MKKLIITVVGKNQVGIIGKVCTLLAEENVDILDITQTIVEGYFNMMMIADGSQAKSSTAELNNKLKDASEEIGVVIRCQHEDIFNKMHRL